MSSLPERHPIIRGELVYLRPSERSDVPTFVKWAALPHRRSWEYGG